MSPAGDSSFRPPGPWAPRDTWSQLVGGGASTFCPQEGASRTGTGGGVGASGDCNARPGGGGQLSCGFW